MDYDKITKDMTLIINDPKSAEDEKLMAIDALLDVPGRLSEALKPIVNQLRKKPQILAELKIHYGRPAITENMAKHMTCPFTKSEPNL